MSIINQYALPELGEVVPITRLIKLAHYYEKSDIVEMLQQVRQPVAPFASDGCSCWPDTILGKYNLYPACFWHDVRYWFGAPGDDVARAVADAQLVIDVARIGCPKIARTMFIGVGVGGGEGWSLPYSWGHGYQNAAQVKPR